MIQINPFAKEPEKDIFGLILGRKHLRKWKENRQIRIYTMGRKP
jgi:hypothetical protein